MRSDLSTDELEYLVGETCRLLAKEDEFMTKVLPNEERHSLWKSIWFNLDHGSVQMAEKQLSRLFDMVLDK